MDGVGAPLGIGVNQVSKADRLHTDKRTPIHADSFLCGAPIESQRAELIRVPQRASAFIRAMLFRLKQTRKQNIRDKS